MILFYQYCVLVQTICFKDSDVWQKVFSNIIIIAERMKDGNFFFIIIVTLVAQGLPPSFFHCPFA